MARKPASPKAEPAAAKPAAPKPDPRRAVIDALFRLAANRSWDEIELPDIARVYLDVMCSGFRARPLPEPVPMISNLIHERYDTKRSRHRKVWK